MLDCLVAYALADTLARILLATYRLGAGRFVLNTLRIRENLGTDPVAERLLRNLLNYAASDLDEPAAELPADFQQQLKAIGYECFPQPSWASICPSSRLCRGDPLYLLGRRGELSSLKTVGRPADNQRVEETVES